MTLILGLVSYGNAFHVSDRLVTQRVVKDGETRVHRFDAFSNKTIVFRARDALTVIGYSGRAYLDNLPTDTWVAQSLLGMDLSRRFSMSAVGMPSAWLDIGRSIRRLRTDCEAAIARLSPSDQKECWLRFNIVGWRWGRGKPRLLPLVCWLGQPTVGSRHVEINYAKRHWAWDRGYTMIVTPDVPVEHSDWLRAELRARGKASPDDCEEVLVESLRRVARGSSTVGENCMCVRLRPGGTPQVEVRYRPRTKQVSPDGLNSPSLAYSPWIVAPPWVWAPNLTNMGWESGPGYRFSWEVRGMPEQLGRRTFVQRSQERPADPQA